MVSDGYAVSMAKESQAIRRLVGQTSCLATVAWIRGCTEPRTYWRYGIYTDFRLPFPIPTFSSLWLFSQFSRNPLYPRLANFSWILFFAIYIHAKLASVSAESLQKLRSRETTWLRLSYLCNSCVRGYHFHQSAEERKNLVWSTEEG